MANNVIQLSLLVLVNILDLCSLVHIPVINQMNPRVPVTAEETSGAEISLLEGDADQDGLKDALVMKGLQRGTRHYHRILFSVFTRIFTALQKRITLLFSTFFGNHTKFLTFFCNRASIFL